jgi:hypothetical protein
LPSFIGASFTFIVDARDQWSLLALDDFHVVIAELSPTFLRAAQLSVANLRAVHKLGESPNYGWENT